MEQALEEGGVALIGLGRPLCVQTDGPRRLLEGAEALPVYERELALLPPALRFLNGIDLLRTLGGFATQYWFYAQLDALGHQGRAEPELGVLRAALRVTAQQRRFLAARREAHQG